MHKYAIQANYDLAADKIASGSWAVDQKNGLVIGSKGKPFTRTNSWGYVQIKFRRPDDWRKEVAVVAHRVIWESEHGPLPEHLHINHINGIKTDNRLPNLELVTPSENMQHAHATGLNRALRGSEHSTAKLTEAKAVDIYARVHQGESPRLLGVEYGVSREVVSNIKVGYSWTHATGAARRFRKSKAPTLTP